MSVLLLFADSLKPGQQLSPPRLTFLGRERAQGNDC